MCAYAPAASATDFTPLVEWKAGDAAAYREAHHASASLARPFRPADDNRSADIFTARSVLERRSAEVAMTNFTPGVVVGISAQVIPNLAPLSNFSGRRVKRSQHGRNRPA